MKLVIGGAQGFVGREVLRQALQCPKITSIVTLGRRPIDIADLNRDKVTEIVMEDGENYSSEVIEKIANADACIWTIAIAMTSAKTAPWEEVQRVTRDFTLVAIDALTKSNTSGGPLRFIYFSGMAISRDLNRDWEALKAIVKPEYLKLRCTLEVELVEYAERSNGAVEVCCIRPGYIIGDRGTPGYQMPNYGSEVPQIKRENVVAAAIKQAVEGIEKDPIDHVELLSTGEEAVATYG